jgi:outer membrane biogenesis lipoprotein LolB
MTRDEVRAKENLPPMGGKAAVLTVQSAMVAIDDMNQGTNAATDAQRAIAAWLGIDISAGVPAKE